MFYNLLTNTSGAAQQPGGSSSIILIIYIVVIVAAMYFFMIRPNKKKQQQEENMRNSIEVGNEILTIGGIYGKVVAVKEDSFIIESGPEKAKIRISKWSVQQNFNAKEPEPKEKIKAKKKANTEEK